MQTKISGRPAFNYLEVDLEPGETIVTLPQFISDLEADLELKPVLNGGFGRALLKKLFSGERLFLHRIKNRTESDRRITLAQTLPGEIRSIKLEQEAFNLQPGTFLACSSGIKLGLRWAGLTSFATREGLLKLQVRGTGTVWYTGLGNLIEQSVFGETVVDTKHLVAYEPSVEVQLQLSGGLFSGLLAGEGLVTRVSGQGKVVLQTRSLSSMTSWLKPTF